MGWSEVGETVCPIARALAVVGDRWTVLILRELFLGVNRFEEIQAQTGMSSHLLSTRLKRLEGDGIVARRPYSDRPPRHEYRLTDKGLDLYPLLLSLKAWGEKWGGFEPKAEPVPKVRTLRSAAVSVVHGRPVRSLATNRNRPAVVNAGQCA
ncbi:MAG: helix-turn-helix transcriptional regulator, partial [Burkholderiales bacterium]|nr:helix-turn-helix transcriptional regulator [Burkholderiales bacterium]